MGKRELIALLNLSSWCLVMVERLFLAVPRGCLQFVIVIFPDHTHLLFLHILCPFSVRYLYPFTCDSTISLTNVLTEDNLVFCSILGYATNGTSSECQQHWPEYGGRDLQS